MAFWIRWIRSLTPHLVLLLVIGMFFIDHRLKKLTKISQAVLDEIKRESYSKPTEEPLPLTRHAD